MENFLHFLWIAFKCAWPILAIYAIYAIIFINSFSPPKNSIPPEKIRAAELELKKKWAEEEAQKQRLSNHSSSHSQGDSGQ